MRPGLVAIVWWMAVPLALVSIFEDAAAQAVSLEFSAIDMYGGAVFPSKSEVGVAFGARVGLAKLFGGAVAAGIELDWWAAERRARNLEVRDIVVGIALWRDLDLGERVHPFLGAGTAVHSVDASRSDGTRFLEGESLVADRLNGYRVGASAFTGFNIKLTRTGNIWFVSEYRYTTVRRVSHHEVRAGARLRFGPR